MGSRRTSQKRSGGVTIHRLRRSLFGPGCAITIEKSLKDLLHTATAAAAHDTQLVEIQYLRLNLLAMLLGHYSKYLQVPTRYKIAYRAMTSISRRHMSEFLKIPANSIPNSGITNGGNYKPLNAGHGSSWTVKPQLFVSKAFLKNVGIMPSNPDSYTVIMEANIHQVPPVFIGNPDKLGGVYFDNSEKEVIGYDKIPLHRVAFLRNTDTNVYLTSQKALEAKVKADLSTVLALLS
jgi:hypothetical protein